MRHRKKKGRISRNISHRKAMLKNMASSLFMDQRIETTMVKAKALRGFAEPLITLAKNSPDSLFARREVYRKLSRRDAVQILFDDLAVLYKDIPGGYTRIMPFGTRKGDGTQMVIMELTKRTISDDDLLGITKRKKEAKRKEKKAEKEEVKKKEETKKKEKIKEKEGEPSVAPEIAAEKKEKRVVEDVKKEKAKTEQKKLTKKGLFSKIFRRKSLG